jgi:hypothetical protein
MMRSSWLAPAALVTTTALAACGGSGPSTVNASGGPGTGPHSPIAFSRCMRAHGVTNFPDPSAGGGISLSPSQARSPGFQSAQQACVKLIIGNRHPPAIGAAQRARMIRMAACMRTHGVPSFPDPQFPAGGGITLGGPGVKLASPAFQQAAQECGGPRPISTGGRGGAAKGRMFLQIAAPG